MAEYSKKLYISKGGNIEAIPLYTDLTEVGTPALRVQDGNNTVFAKLGTGTRAASSLKCASGGTTYSAMKGSPSGHPNKLITGALLHFDESTTKDEIASANFITWTEGSGGATLTSNGKFGKALSGSIEGTVINVMKVQQFADGTTIYNNYDYFFWSNSGSSFGMWIYIPSKTTLATIITQNNQMLEFFKYVYPPAYPDQYYRLGIFRVSSTEYYLGYALYESNYNLSTPRRIMVPLSFTDAGWHHLVIQQDNNLGNGHSSFTVGLDGTRYNVWEYFVSELHNKTGGKFILSATDGILIDEFFIANLDPNYSTSETRYAYIPTRACRDTTYTVPTSPYV